MDVERMTMKNGAGTRGIGSDPEFPMVRYQTDIRHRSGLAYRIHLAVVSIGRRTVALQRHVWYPSRDNPARDVTIEDWIDTLNAKPNGTMREVSEFTI